MTDEELKNLTARAENGDDEAQYRLGKIYMYGMCGVRRCEKRGAGFFRLAAKQGYNLAVRELEQYKERVADRSDSIRLDGKILPLKKKEILAMRTIVVKDNTIKGLRYGGGYRGRGGTNLSDYTETGGRVILLTELEGQKPLFIETIYIRAVVNDVVYFTNKFDSVFAFNARKGFYCSYEVAYDTQESYSVTAVE
ncbi:MAG: sel1 repeat family protein [Clostridiales bacterium]|nr:sel1 repeat family protein [Clostridiales bacterium]